MFFNTDDSTILFHITQTWGYDGAGMYRGCFIETGYTCGDGARINYKDPYDVALKIAKSNALLTLPLRKFTQGVPGQFQERGIQYLGASVHPELIFRDDGFNSWATLWEPAEWIKPDSRIYDPWGEGARHMNTNCHAFYMYAIDHGIEFREEGYSDEKEKLEEKKWQEIRSMI